MAENWWDEGTGVLGWLWNNRPGAGPAKALAPGDPGYVYSQEEIDYDRQERIRQGAEQEAERARIEQGVADKYKTPEERESEREFTENIRGKSAADRRRAEAEAEQAALENRKLQRDLESGGLTPKEEALLQIQMASASATLTRAQLELEKSRGDLSQADTIRLNDELQRARAQEAEALALERESRTREFQLQLEQGRQGFDLAREDRADARLQRTEASAEARSLRDYELNKWRSQADLAMSTWANQIAEGKLSVDAAGKKFDALLAKAKAPSEIMANVSRAMEPYLPYLTSKKTGDIPMGFQSGGPMEQLTKMGGGTYDPQTYAAKPITVDPFALAKQAGADFSKTKIPDPNKMFKVPSITPPMIAPPPMAGPSASMAGPAMAAAPLTEAPMIANKLPTGADSLTDDERARIDALLSGVG